MKSDIMEPSVRETVSGRLVSGKVLSGTETGARKTGFRYFGVKETVFTVSKCPNYLKMSQYLKTSQLSQNGPRHCFIFSRALFNVWNRVFLEMLPLEIMLKIQNYAKMCGKRQIIWTVPHLPHQKVGYNDWINIKPMS